MPAASSSSTVQKDRTSHARDVMRPGFIAKLIIMMLIDALGIYGIMAAWAVDSWIIIGVMAFLLIVINWVYFSKRALPAKYLLPGMIFLLIYQLFVMGYTGYVSLTNYGDGHNSTKTDAIEAILASNRQRVEGAPTVQTAVVEDGSELGLVIADPTSGELKLGTATKPLQSVQGTVTAMGITDVSGYKILDLGDLASRQTEVSQLTVPVSSNLDDGYYVTTDGTSGYLAKSTFTYDEAADTLTNTQDGVVYKANNQKGVFEDSQGNQLSTGWRVFVGASNYSQMFSGSGIVKPFLNALVWSFVFAIGSVLSTFAFGLILALIFSDKRIRGRKIYQSLMILPYAFPGFLAILVWKGMLNEQFGFINNVLLGGAQVPWLTNGLMAKVAILGVNLWLGLGALQSLPGDVEEAAKMDGASGLRTIWSIKLPLVLQSTTPLLIASFAFNFNNFSLIYMLTKGGPDFEGVPYALGQTDILISMVYKIAFAGGQYNYGLASAMSIFIFAVVGVIAWLGFRQTKALEEL